MSKPASYSCPKCHAESFNPHDIEHLYCGACKTFAADLRDEVVTEFAHLTKQHLTRKDCFSLAALTLLDSPDNSEARLVHAWVQDTFNPGRYIQHAWCEFPAEGTFEDGSTGPVLVVVDYTQPDERARFLERGDVYQRTGVRDARYFTRLECVANALRYGHDGPWPDGAQEKIA